MMTNLEGQLFFFPLSCFQRARRRRQEPSFLLLFRFVFLVWDKESRCYRRKDAGLGGEEKSELGGGEEADSAELRGRNDNNNNNDQ